MNRVDLVGRLTRDPELRYTANNAPYCFFTLAIDRNQSQQPGVPATDFISVTAWNRTAELVKQYMTKGRQIAVEGTLQSRSFDDKNGQRQYRMDVVANRVEFLGSRNELNNSTQYENQAPNYTQNTNSYANNNVNTNKQDNITPYDFGDNNQGQDISNDPYKDFGAEVQINDDELPF